MPTGTIATYESRVDLAFEWKIDNFFNLPERDGACNVSPNFSFGGERWELWIIPNGSSENDSSGHVNLGLDKWNSDRSIKQSFSLSLKTAKGEKYNEQHGTKDFDNYNWFHRFNRFIPRSELNNRKSDLVPDGTLTVICTMKSSTSAGSNTCVEACTQTQKHVFRQACTQTQKHVLRQASTQTVEEKYFNCREKLLIVLCIANILIAIVIGNALAYSKTPLSSSHPCGEAVKKIQISEINKAVNRSEVVESNEFNASGSNEAGATDIKQSEGLNETSELNAKLNKADESEIAGSEIPEASAANQADSAKTGESESVKKTLAAEMNKTDQSEIAGSDIPEASAANEADTAETDESEGVNKTLAAELKKADQSEIARSDTPEASAANQADSAKTDESEAVTKIQTSEINKVDNRSDVVAPKEFEASGSNETGATDIKEYEGVNKTLAAEFKKADHSENAGSDIPEYFAANQAHTAETDESEPIPQPVLMVTEVGSTYLEVVWVLPEESKSNAAHIHYVVHFRKYGTQWQEVAFPDASRTSYTLTNPDPGMSYQIYVMAVDSSGFSRSSETATIRTSNNVISHNSPKGHEKQFVFYAAAIIILVIVIACVYDYSKTSLSATHPYGGGTQTISAEDNIIKADLSEIAEANESENSDSKTCSTETEGPVLFKNQPEDYGFVTDINHLLKENRGIDVTFELETPNGKTKLFAHKLILAVMSSYFADEFYDEGRNKGHQVIPLKGIDPKAFEQMIRYCYGEKPIFKTIEEACVLFKIASEFKVISLQNLCCNFFRHTKINPGNVFSILEISEEMEDKSLKDKCRKILQDKTREVIASYELRDVTPAMVHILLDLPNLSLNSEYELIKWIFDWAKVKSEDEDSSCRSTRDYLAKLLQNINFLALTVEEFAILSRENPKVFNSDERASISLNIACPGSWEMPVWYNKDLKLRVYTGSIE